MPAITILDLTNAKLDVDHIAEIATSGNPTAVDRMGQTKKTLTGAIATIAAITNRGAWSATPSPATYAVKDVVQFSGTWYIAVIAHTPSPAFATDLASKWRVYQGVTTSDLAGSTITSTLGFGMRGSLADKLNDIVSVKDFGARGDGLAATPASESVDIMSAAWNTWAGSPFQTNLGYSPYGTSGSFSPPTAQPFQNTDTWDYIGCQRALWAGARSVFFPVGTYKINFSTARAGVGLVIMKGQGQTLYGASVFDSLIVPSQDAAFFSANHPGEANYYKLLWEYRIGGASSNVHSLNFQGPSAYPTAAKNLTLIHCSNINGVTHRDLWLSAAARGINADTNSGDSHIKGITTEFLFDSAIQTDAGSEFSIDFCNLWASSVLAGQRGVVAAGRVAITNTRLIDFQGGAVVANSGLLTGSTVRANAGGAANAVSLATDAVIVGNDMEGGMGDAMVHVGPSSLVSANRIKVTSAHAAIDCGTGAAASAVNISILGNTLIKTDNSAGAQNVMITATQAGVGYTQAATQSLVIEGNTQQGNAMAPLGVATMGHNSINGVMQDGVYAQRQTFTGPVAMLGLSSFANDAAAAAGGVTVGGLYRNGSAIQVRVA